LKKGKGRYKKENLSLSLTLSSGRKGRNRQDACFNNKGTLSE